MDKIQIYLICGLTLQGWSFWGCDDEGDAHRRPAAVGLTARKAIAQHHQEQASPSTTPTFMSRGVLRLGFLGPVPASRRFVNTSIAQFPKAEDSLLTKGESSTFQTYLREKVIYTNPSVRRFYPTLNDFLVAVQLDHQARIPVNLKFERDKAQWGYYQPPGGLPPSLEIVVAYALYACHYCCVPDAVSRQAGGTRDDLAARMEANLMLVVQEYLGDPHFSWPLDVGTTQKAMTILSLYVHSTPDVITAPPYSAFGEVLEKAVYAAELMGIALPLLHQWIASIIAPTPTHACRILGGMSGIPAFVMVDIIQRNPKSTLELDLLLEIYRMHAADLHRVEPMEHMVVRNLLVSCILYNSRRAVQVVETYLAQADVTQPACRSFLNSLMYEVTTRRPLRPHPRFNAHLFDIQWQISTALATQKPLLETEGFLGLAAAVSVYSEAQSVRSLGYSEELMAAEPRPAGREMAHLLTKLRTSGTLDALVSNFQLATHAKANERSPELWSELVVQLQRLGVLNRKRALNLLTQVVDLRVAIPASLASQLLSHLEGFTEFQHHVEALGFLPLLSVSSYLIHAYTDCIRNTDGCLNKPYRHFFSMLDYARSLYRALETPTVSQIGMMLFGEMHFQPGRIFHLYQQEYAKHGHEFPDERALYVLLATATRNPRPRGGNREDYDSGNPQGMLRWNDMFAVQVAMREFKRSVMASVKVPKAVEDHPSDHLVYPSHNLWAAYLQALVQFGYTEELVYALSWWEELEYVPNEQNLLTLLLALPEGHADSLVRDVTKNHSVPTEAGVFSVSLWPWPSPEHLGALRS